MRVMIPGRSFEARWAAKLECRAAVAVKVADLAADPVAPQVGAVVEAVGAEAVAVARPAWGTSCAPRSPSRPLCSRVNSK